MAADKNADSRLLRPDLLLLVVLGIAGIFFFFARFDESFPAASIDLRLTRAQITAEAEKWSSKLGYDTRGSIQSTVFSYDDDAKTFLEYELGQSRANELMRTQVPIWMWQTRFCRPFQIEELSVSLAPDGKLLVISRKLPNELAMPSISHQAALKLASDFIKEATGVLVDGMKEIKDGEEKQAHRTDHYFYWEDEAHDFKGGHLRYVAYVSGDRVTGFSQYLHVPEKFERKYNEIRSYNDLLKTVSSVIYIVLQSAITFIFIWAFVSGRIRWKLAFGAGIVAAILSLLSFIDGWPSVIAAYRTTIAFDQYVMQSLVSLAISACYAGIAAIMFIGALEPIYRLNFPQKVAFEQLLSGLGLRSVPVINGLIAGLALFGIHTAYVVAYYLLGNRFDFWSPLEVRDFNTISGLWPVFSAINVGINASVTEEFMYRVLALFIFQRMTRNFWVANFLQAASWAFMHSDYPQEPAYARGVELTIIGFFYGYVLKRYGLLPCILAHYTYDAFLGVTPLIVSPLLKTKLTSILAVLPGPAMLAISLLLIARKGKNEDVESLSNHAIAPAKPPHVVPEPEPPTAFDYTPVARSVLIGTVLCSIISLCIVFLLPMRMVGSNEPPQVDAEQATHIAADYLMKEGLSTKGRRSLAYLSDEADDLQLQYVFEKEKYNRTKDLAKNLSPRLSWKVWFFKELDPEQFYVAVSPDGKVVSQWVIEDEDAAGAKLTEVEARRLAEDFLNREYARFKPFIFEDATKQEQKNRNDYSFTYRVDQLKVGEAEFKVRTGVIGKYVSGYSRSWDIPDNWRYEREKVTEKDNVLSYVRWTYYVIMSVLGLWWFIFTLRTCKIEWRWPIIVGCASAVIACLRQLNALPMLFANYSPDLKISIYLAKYLSQVVISILSGAAGMGLLTALSLASFNQALPSESLRNMLHSAIGGDKHGFEGKRRMWLDGVVMGYGIVIILGGGIQNIFDAIEYMMSPAVRIFGLAGAVTASQQWSPSLGAILDGASMGLLVPLGILITVAFYRKFFARRSWLIYSFIVITPLITFSYLRYWQDYLWETSAVISMGLVTYYFITRSARNNPLIYVFAGFGAAASSVAWSMARNAWSLYYVHVMVILLALAAPLVYVAWLYWGPRNLTERVPEIR
jgi:hypothetical protein